jgi:hypothetical protein
MLVFCAVDRTSGVSRTSLTRAQAVAIITMRGGAVW